MPEIPLVSDGTILRVLDKLLILDGERLSYRALDVENIGSVYEGIMGYRVERAERISLGVVSNSTTVVIDMEALLSAKPNDRSKLLKEWANCEIKGNPLQRLKSASTLEALAAALDRRVSPLTETLLPAGTLYLQPTEARRRSGSHYTSRKLTEKVVKIALEPIVAELGANFTAEAVLNLKVCDPAMGSGAFLVEACRQLADLVNQAWQTQGLPTDLPTDEESIVFARRLVAQRCIYGVDVNPFAVNLAKLSLWLATLAKKYPFTFLDHALKCGDSLVGLTSGEIGAFSSVVQLNVFLPSRNGAQAVASKRLTIQSRDTLSEQDVDAKQEILKAIEQELAPKHRSADVKVLSFLEGTKARNAKERRALEDEYRILVAQGTAEQLAELSQRLRHEHRLAPFNWELEFPEVFVRDNGGFDVIVGNPPFAGKNTVAAGHTDGYPKWLQIAYPESHGNSDLVAYFFRRAFALLRQGGTMGMVATNTIAQGDTRSTGLRYICNNGGTIYNVVKRHKWEGKAAVIEPVCNHW